MKKNNNLFRETHVSNILKILGVVCVVLVVSALALLLLSKENRQHIQNWFTGKKVEVATKKNPTENAEDIGINGAAVINENSQVTPLSLEDHLWGNIGAPVQLIIYEDFQCPFCAQLYDTVQQAKTEFGSDLVIAVRHFPLSSHELALPAANAAECAADQEKFWEMYHELFTQNKNGTLSVESIKEAGKTLQLDETTYNNCLTNVPHQAKILAQKETVKKLGVGGTPASFINNEYVAGAIPYTDFTHPDGSAAEGLRSMIRKKLGN